MLEAREATYYHDEKRLNTDILAILVICVIAAGYFIYRKLRGL